MLYNKNEICYLACCGCYYRFGYTCKRIRATAWLYYIKATSTRPIPAIIYWKEIERQRAK